MKNTLYTLALLVSFSSFGQFSEGYFESINDIIPPFDKCSEDFFINDEYLIDSFLETLESSEDSLYLTNTQRTLFGKKLTLHWAKEEVEFLFDYYNRFGWDTDLDTIEQSDKELIVYDIKEALIKVSFSQKKTYCIN